MAMAASVVDWAYACYSYILAAKDGGMTANSYCTLTALMSQPYPAVLYHIEVERY